MEALSDGAGSRVRKMRWKLFEGSCGMGNVDEGLGFMTVKA